MRRNIFYNFFSVLVVFLLISVAFKLSNTNLNDFRLRTAAAHSCANIGYPYSCSGTCGTDQYCGADTTYSCSCKQNYHSPTPSPWPTIVVPTVPPSLYNCDTNPYCIATCKNSSCTTDNATLVCYSGPGGKVCDGYSSDYWVYRTKCCNAPTGTTGTTCTACYNVAGYCQGNPGWYDNCGGTGCGYCPGTNPSATAVPTSPGGGTVTCKCSDYTSTAATVCSNSTFYCPGSSPATYCYGTKGCSVPTLSKLILNNANGVGVTADSDGRNNNWNAGFTSSSDPSAIDFVAMVSDDDGYDHIAKVDARWNGNIYSLSFFTGSALDAGYSGVVNFTSADYDSGTYPIYVRMTNTNGDISNWINSGRSLKIWDGKVSVTGTVYDSSASQTCSAAFDNTISASANFSSILFTNTSGTEDISMTVDSPNFGTGDLTWGQSYLPLVNGGSVSNPDGDLEASGRFTQIEDTGADIVSCPVSSQFNIGNYVSPYSTSPKAKVDLSYIRNQEAWFQVSGAGVKAANELGSGVPATMTENLRALSIAGTNSDNGLVSFSTYSNINGNNVDTDYGRPNDWWLNQNTNDGTVYNYQYFYNNFYIKNGVGTTINGLTWTPSEGIYFVNGDLTISNNVSIASDKYLMIIVSGKIGIESTVSRLDGIYIADGGIESLDPSDNQLVINGMLYSRGKIRLARSFNDKGLNNSEAGILIKYNPSLIFNIPGKLVRVLSGWREE